MDACTRVNSEFEDFVPCVNDPRLHTKRLHTKVSYVRPKQCDTYNIVEETVKVTSVEDLNILEECGINEKDNLTVEELESAFSEILHVLDVHEQSSAHNLSSDQDVICNPKDDSVQQELKILQPVSLDVNTKKGLSKSATFPCSEKAQISLIPIDVGEGIPSTSLHSQSFSESDKTAYAQSTSLPATLKLVSAMKGGREKQGAPPKEKLNVKWAPDVYDPPATSLSHTVKNRHQRPKGKKDHHKHKHKGKSSSRGSTGEKKHASRRSIIDPLHLRLQAPGKNRSLLDTFGQSSVECLDYTVSGPESKCGSSFLVGSLAKVQFSIAVRPPGWNF